MSKYNRKKFREFYEKYHDLEGNYKFIAKKQDGNMKKIELHHIIPFKTVKHSVSKKIVESLLNFIYLDKALHDELSKKIDGEDIRYFGIKFSKDDTGAYNYISLFDIRSGEGSLYRYFKYNDEIRFRNGELVFFKPELAMAIEIYNRICIEINKIQLKAKWKSKKFNKKK